MSRKSPTSLPDQNRVGTTFASDWRKDSAVLPAGCPWMQVSRQHAQHAPPGWLSGINGVCSLSKWNMKRSKIIDKPSSWFASSTSCPQGPPMSQPYNSDCAEVCTPPGAGEGLSMQAHSWPSSCAPAKLRPDVENTAGFPFNSAVAAVVAAIVGEGWKPGKQMCL